MVTRLSPEDHARVAAAVSAAEGSSNGEIVTIATDLSDKYHDVALHWAVAVLIAVLAWFAAFPDCLTWSDELLFGGWRVAPGPHELLTLLMVLAVLKFTVVLLILRWMPLRLALTPGATKQRRVRRRAVELFKVGAEQKTVGRTGILIYLSLGERRAEIVADEAILAVTTPETWGEAMTVLLADTKVGRPADGICAAVGLIGEVLATHFPKTAEDTNEIPDKLIEL
ncbi:MAG: TPM domain-containing protein [Sphingomicrobium sp.]